MAEEKMKNHNESSSEESGEEESEESGSEQESTRIMQNHPPAVPKSAPHKENEEEEEEDESGSEDSQSESQRSTHHSMKSSAADVNGFVPKSKTQDESASEEGSEYEEEDEEGEQKSPPADSMKSSAADVNGFVPKSKTQDESASEEGSEYEEEDEEGEQKSPPADSPHNGVPNSMNDNFEEGSEDKDVDERKRFPSITGKTKAANKGEVQAQGEKSKKAQGENSKKRQARGELAIMVESKKRQAQDDSSKRAKKKNRVAEKPNGAITSFNPNNSAVQRVWTANDVVVILEGMIDFKLKKGVDPAKQMTEFHNYIKRLLHANFNTNQLKCKIRRLKEKYINNFNKYKEGRCKNEHEWKTYDLSKQIWGSDSNTSKKKPSSLNERVEVIDDQYNETVALWNKDGHNPCVEARIIYNALEHMKGRKRMKFEKKLKKLNVEEAEVYLKRVELVREAATVYLKGDKSGRN